ncbi:MAG: protein kinase [Anaerolineae bacterium]|nr:protein kinase [Anaerolineae bacterium]
MSGARLSGKYEIQGELGRGGMGIVYQAYDLMLRRVVAIKVLSPKLLVDPDFVKRFRHEAVAVANLRHPNIITIYDVGEDTSGEPPNDVIHYIVMEYIEGQTLDRWLRENRRPMQVTDVDQIVSQVGQALQYAHDRGVIHRDIKPSNIMIDGEGRAKLMDFGLVRAGELSRLTRSGTVLGTPQYMAPEQIIGQDVDARTDIYSLGVVIYELLVGEMPFVRTTPMATAYAHVNELPPPLRTKRPDASKSVEAVVMKALAKDPTQRYQTASQLARDFAVAATGAMPVGLKEYVPPKQLEQTMAMSQPITPPKPKSVTPPPPPRDATPPPVQKAMTPPPTQVDAKPRRTGLIIAVAAVILALLLGAAAGVLATRSTSTSEEPAVAITTPAATTETPAAAVAQPDSGSVEASATVQAALAEAEAARNTTEELETELRVVNGLKLTYASRSVLSSDQELATALAIEAARRSDSDETTSALRDTLAQPAYAVAVLGGHTDAIQSSNWNADGSKAATGSADGTVRIWDGFTGAPLQTFSSDGAPVNSVVWHPDGKRVASGAQDGNVTIWDLDTGGALRTLEAHDGAVRDLDWDQDGRRLASAGNDAIARVWDAASGQQLVELTGHEGNVLSIEWSPDGTQLVTSSEDNTARIWDASDGSLLATLSGHTNFVFQAHWNGDGSQILTASRDNQAWVWDATTGEPIIKLTGHTEPVFNAEWSPDETRILTGSRDSLAKVWDATTGEEQLTLVGHVGSVNNIDWSPDGALIATIGADGLGRLWQAADGSLLAVLTGHTSQAGNIHWSPDGQRLLTHGRDFTGRIWTLQDTGLLLDREAGGAPLSHVTWSTAGSGDPNGDQLATVADGGIATIWDAATGTILHRLAGLSGLVSYAAWQPAAGSNDGAWLVTTGQDGAKVWDTSSGELVSTYTGHGSAEVTFAEWSPDGERVATASRDGSARIWDPATGETLLDLLGHDGRVLLVRWSPDGSRVVTGSVDGTARVWDSETGTELLNFTNHNGGRLLTAAWSPDGRRIATGSSDQTARIWDAQTGEEQGVINVHLSDVVTVAWSPDGSQLVTGSLDNTLRVWDAASLEELAVLTGHKDDVTSAEWSPDGSLILSGSVDGTARVWDAATGAPVAVLKGPDGPVVNAAWSTDGARIAMASSDGTAWVHWLRAEDLQARACQHVARNLSEGEWERYVGIDPYQATCDGKPIPGQDFQQLGITD